jgi:RND family efflux transporter MFP subunit
VKPGNQHASTDADEDKPKAKKEEPKHAEPKKAPPKHGGLILGIVGVVAVVAIGLFVLIKHHRHSSADDDERRKREEIAAKGPEVPYILATPAPIMRKIVLPGDIRPYQLATVYARVSGYLAELDVDRGDHVEKNRVLGRVTTPETELQLLPLEANLSTKRAIADRLKPLVPAGVVSQQDLDRAIADVQQAKSEVDRLRALKNFDEIRAPFSGVVTKRYVDVGALMPAPTGATSSAQPLVDVADTSRVRVVIYVGQHDATGVQLGDPVSIQRDDDPLHPVKATVTRIPRELDLRTRTMWVEADVDNADGVLYPGLFVTVAMEVPAASGVVIPSDAISLIKGTPAVALMADGKVHFQEIEVADDDGKLARVVNGVKPGDMVAMRISDELIDGGKVRPIDPEEAKKRATQGAGSGSGSTKTASNEDK